MVNALAVSGTTVYVGGVFELVNAMVIPGTGLRGEGRRNLAAVDAVTGVATPWNPDIFEGEVRALTLVGSVAYAGGSFEQVGLIGQETIRLNLAAFDVSSGAAAPWNPSVRGVNGDVVYTLQMSDDVVYVGGRFDEVGGQARHNLATVDRATGLATGFDVPTNDTVFTLFDDGLRLYVGDCSPQSGVNPEIAWPPSTRRRVSSLHGIPMPMVWSGLLSSPKARSLWVESSPGSEAGLEPCSR